MKYIFGIFILMIITFCGTNSSLSNRWSNSQGLTVINPTISIPQNTDRGFNFAFLGDLHVLGTNTDRLKQILYSCKRNNVEFIIFLGDIVDNGSRESYQAFVDTIHALGWGKKIIPVLGNHDVFENGWEYYKMHFGANHGVIHAGPLILIVLDTADGAVGLEQKKWLKQVLSENRSSMNIILSHYMPTSLSIETYLKLAKNEEANSLMSIAEMYGVRAWLGGHYHSYMKKNIKNVTYVISGGGGRRMPPVKKYFYVLGRVFNNTLEFVPKILPEDPLNIQSLEMDK